MPLVTTLTINPALDLTVPVDEVVSGPKLRCGRARMDPGGGGINVARVLHRLAVPTAVRGESVVESSALGMAAAAATLLTPGTQLCHVDDIENLRKRIEVFDL